MSVIHDANGRGISSDNPLNVKQAGSDVQMPVDIQSRYQQTVQTHNAVSVAASGESQGAWIDTNGFHDVSATLLNDAATTSTLSFFWSNDGSTTHGIEHVLSNTEKNKAASATIKARYMKVRIHNGDTAAHVMSAWAYLKA